MTDQDQSLSLSVATFAQDLCVQEKQDVSDLLLQADVFASMTWNRRQYWKSWADYHRNRMLKHGCEAYSLIITEPLFLTREEELQQSIRLNILDGDGSPRLPQMAEQSLVTAGYKEFALNFLRSGSEESFLGDFQVVPCTRTATGEVEIFVCGLHVTGRVSGDKRELVLRLNGGSYLFSVERYAAHRAQVRRHLERYAAQRIRHVEL